VVSDAGSASLEFGTSAACDHCHRSTVLRGYHPQYDFERWITPTVREIALAFCQSSS